MSQTYFEKDNNRLVMFGDGSSPDFWDSKWEKNNFKEGVIKSSSNDLILKNTREFLKPEDGVKILEGGCGDGHFVLSLKNAGYDVWGIDNAKKTVEKVNKNFPELKVYLGDLRRMTFSNNIFDGFWSLGVIEHDYNGYNDMLLEMKRVIKDNGYLFITFPAMSPVRKLKAKLGLYKEYKEEDVDLDSFYQFALDPEKVVSGFEKHGFKLKKKKFINGSGGITREFKLLNFGPLRRPLKKIGRLFEFFFGHSVLLVLKNNE